MSGELVSINFKFPDFLERYRVHFKTIQREIAADIQTNIGLRFANEGNYNGHPKWQDLASGKNLKKADNGLKVRMILQKTGALKNSIAPSNPKGEAGKEGYVEMGGDLRKVIVKVGTNIKYARIHNEGGVIKFPGTDNGFGRGIKIKAHSIGIPRRNFTDWNDQDAKNMKGMLKALLSALNDG